MFSLLTILAFFIAVYLMNKAFFGFQPGSKKINSDVSKFRQGIEKWKGELVPWNSNEIELFSFNHRTLVKKRGFGVEREGIFQSIYEEPMLYYHYKEYPSTNNSALTLAKTANYEFIYRTKGKSTKVFVDENYIGSIMEDGSFYNESKRRSLAKIRRSEYPLRSIMVDEKRLGYITYPENKDQINPRAFDLDHIDDQHEKVIFMILGIYEVVQYVLER